jgi:hypothetical protein
MSPASGWMDLSGSGAIGEGLRKKRRISLNSKVL